LAGNHRWLSSRSRPAVHGRARSAPGPPGLPARTPRPPSCAAGTWRGCPPAQPPA